MIGNESVFDGERDEGERGRGRETEREREGG